MEFIFQNMETDITAELKDDSIIANVEYFT